MISLIQLNVPPTPTIKLLNEGIIKQGKTEERKCVDKQLEIQMLKNATRLKDAP